MLGPGARLSPDTGLPPGRFRLAGSTWSSSTWPVPPGAQAGAQPGTQAGQAGTPRLSRTPTGHRTPTGLPPKRAWSPGRQVARRPSPQLQARSPQLPSCGVPSCGATISMVDPSQGDARRLPRWSAVVGGWDGGACSCPCPCPCPCPCGWTCLQVGAGACGCLRMDAAACCRQQEAPPAEARRACGVSASLRRPRQRGSGGSGERSTRLGA